MQHHGIRTAGNLVTGRGLFEAYSASVVLQSKQQQINPTLQRTRHKPRSCKHTGTELVRSSLCARPKTAH